MFYGIFLATFAQQIFFDWRGSDESNRKIPPLLVFYTKQKQIHTLLFYETVVRKNAIISLISFTSLVNISVYCDNKIGAVK